MTPDCVWPQGCFQIADPDDKYGLCGYHVKVLNGLITARVPDNCEADLIELKKRQHEATRLAHARLPGARLA